MFLDTKVYFQNKNPKLSAFVFLFFFFLKLKAVKPQFYVQLEN